MKTMFIYGIGGADKQFRVLRYTRLDDDDITVFNIRYEAEMMRIRNPSIERVYVMDNRRGLSRDFMDSIKKNTIESCAIFKDILEREGILVLSK